MNPSFLPNDYTYSKYQNGRFKRTLVPVCGSYFQYSCSWSLVFHHLGLKLCSLKHRRFIVHINNLHRQHLRGGELRNPLILCYNGQIEDFLLLPV